MLSRNVDKEKVVVKQKLDLKTSRQKSTTGKNKFERMSDTKKCRYKSSNIMHDKLTKRSVCNECCLIANRTSYLHGQVRRVNVRDRGDTYSHYYLMQKLEWLAGQWHPRGANMLCLCVLGWHVRDLCNASATVPIDMCKRIRPCLFNGTGSLISKLSFFQSAALSLRKV